MACGPCHDLIEAGERDGLLDRAMTQRACQGQSASIERFLRTMLAEAYELFDEKRTGPPYHCAM